jgi:hypothetical protein
MRGLGIGRIVHYVIPEGEFKNLCRPAIVTQIWSNFGVINIVVFSELGAIPINSVHFDETKIPNSWHWPDMENQTA